MVALTGMQRKARRKKPRLWLASTQVKLSEFLERKYINANW